MIEKRNTEKVEIFGNEYDLSERSAYDVLSLTEFASKPENQNYSSTLYQYALIVESALKGNKKELPTAYKDNLIKKIIRKIFGSSKYKKFTDDLIFALEYNQKIKYEYLLEHLSQKELYNLVKKVYSLEGIDLDKIKEITEKKNLAE